MNTPKLLPWYARKAGVSLDRADKLWRDALREATENAGRAGETEYSGEAMQGLIERLERERDVTQYPSDVCFLVRSHARLWKLPLTVMEGVFNSASAHWQRRINLTLRRVAHSREQFSPTGPISQFLMLGRGTRAAFGQYEAIGTVPTTLGQLG